MLSFHLIPTELGVNHLHDDVRLVKGSLDKLCAGQGHVVGDLGEFGV